MLIKLESVQDVMIKDQWAGKEVTGTRVDSGETWSKNFFADNKDLRNQLEEFGIGDIVNVQMKQQGKFWNINGFSTASADMIEKVKNSGSNRPTPPSYSPPTAAKSTAKSGWNGRTGEAYDRSAAIYLAVDIMKENKTAKEKIKVGDAFILADAIFNYIHDGINPARSANEEGKDVDPLTPPTVE